MPEGFDADGLCHEEMVVALRWEVWAVLLVAVVFFFQAEDGIRDDLVTGVQTCALPISCSKSSSIRLGLIDDDFEHALQMLRKIRNDFAHSVVKSSFSESNHRNRVMELVRMAKKFKSDSGESFQAYFARIVPAHVGSSELRDFCAAVHVLLITLEVTAGNTNRFIPGVQARFF